MKHLLSKLSLAGNVVLVAALAWLYMDYRANEAETEDIMRMCARADEHYILLLADSLSALEPLEGEEATKFKETVRPLVAAGLQNIELRKAVGFPR